jgi:hypothetical protein
LSFSRVLGIIAKPPTNPAQSYAPTLANINWTMRLTITIIFLFSIKSVAADCLACWELRKVEIKFNDGSKKTGFVYWNEAWLNGNLKNWEKWANRFQESFLELHKTSPDQKIHMLTKVFTVNNDSLFEFKATTKKHQLELDVKDVMTIVEVDKASKKYQGAGDIPVYSEEDIQILNSNPFATYTVNISVADIYFLSYNKNIDRKKLKKITEEKPNAQPAELRKIGVLIVNIGYD